MRTAEEKAAQRARDEQRAAEGRAQRAPIAPTVTVREGLGGGTQDLITHPAFGVLSASRISGGDNTLFASSIENHYGTVRITLRAAELHREAYSENVFGRQHLFEVELSEAQWVSFVSRPNHGEGTPVTIRSRVVGKDGEEYRDMPRIARQPKPIDELERKLIAMLDDQDARGKEFVTKLRALLDGKVSQRVLAEAMGLIELVLGHGKTTRDFQRERLQEATNRMVNESKIEIESLGQAMVNNFGLASVRELGLLLQADPTRALRALNAPIDGESTPTLPDRHLQVHDRVEVRIPGEPVMIGKVTGIYRDHLDLLCDDGASAEVLESEYQYVFPARSQVTP